MRVVIAPDSFKGSLAAPAVASAIAEGVGRAVPSADLRLRPMADGGEGTLDAVLAASGPTARRATTRVAGASGRAVDAAYGLIAGAPGATAVLECAQVVPITDAVATSAPVGARSTLGLGEQLRSLLDLGVRRMMIGLGGSSTNDGGAGLLAALGLALVDARGHAIEPTPAGLDYLAGADASALDPRLAECEITIMSDVNNPLCGPMGATAVFGPQKGVAAADINGIDRTIARYAAMVERATGRRCADRPGAGAAGGLGFALMQVGGSMRSGAAVVADLIGLDDALAGADWAITGEGRSDAQTLLSKGPAVVADRARAAGVAVSLLSGAVDPAALPSLAARFDGCFALPAGPASLESCVHDAAALLADRAEAMARLFVSARARSLAATGAVPRGGGRASSFPDPESR